MKNSNVTQWKNGSVNVTQWSHNKSISHSLEVHGVHCTFAICSAYFLKNQSENKKSSWSAWIWINFKWHFHTCTLSVVTETVMLYRGDVNLISGGAQPVNLLKSLPVENMWYYHSGGGVVARARGKGVIAVNCVEGLILPCKIFHFSYSLTLIYSLDTLAVMGN